MTLISRNLKEIQLKQKIVMPKNSKQTDRGLLVKFCLFMDFISKLTPATPDNRLEFDVFERTPNYFDDIAVKKWRFLAKSLYIENLFISDGHPDLSPPPPEGEFLSNREYNIEHFFDCPIFFCYLCK